jgi:KDO2-lipid IV(A) lauroyltransferase
MDKSKTSQQTGIIHMAGEWKRTFKLWRRRLTDPLIAAALWLFLLVFQFFSLQALRRLARVIGSVACRFDKRDRRLVQENLRVAFPQMTEDEIKVMAPQIFASGSLLLLEIVWAARHREQLATHVHIPETLMEFVRRPGGCLLVTPHLGNWEILGQAGVAAGVPCAVVAKPLRNALVYKLVMESRRRNGLDVIDTEGAVRQIVKALRKNYAIGILVDQCVRIPEGGVFIDFFGLPATCTRAPASLAMKLNVPVVVLACVRTRTGFELVYETLPKPAPEYTDELQLTQDIILANEKLIRARPAEYSWLYRRWRHIPADATPEERRRYPAYAGDVEWKARG